MNDLIDLTSKRAVEARLAHKIGPSKAKLMLLTGWLILATALVLIIFGFGMIGGPLGSVGLILIMPAIWYKKHLSVLPVSGGDLAGTLSQDVLARLKPAVELSPLQLWKAISSHWQAGFITNRLLLSSPAIEQQLSTYPADLHLVFAKAGQLALQRYYLPLNQLQPCSSSSNLNPRTSNQSPTG